MKETHPSCHHTHTRTHTHTNTHTHTQTHTHRHSQTHTHTQTHAYIHTHTHKDRHTHTHRHMHTCTHTHLHTHTQTHTHTQIHTHTHTHRSVLLYLYLCVDISDLVLFNAFFKLILLLVYESLSGLFLICCSVIKLNQTSQMLLGLVSNSSGLGLLLVPRV